jgi:hypothetical protein
MAGFAAFVLLSGKSRGIGMTIRKACDASFYVGGVVLGWIDKRFWEPRHAGARGDHADRTGCNHPLCRRHLRHRSARVLLLIAWAKSRIDALAWWGAAYLVGGLSVAAWSLEGPISPSISTGIANALLFVACGMMWNAARVFHGRPVLASALIGGPVAWLFACTFTDFAQWPAARIVLSSAIVASYTFATAVELWRERRKSLRRCWPAVFVPMLYGAILLLPIPLASLLPADGGTVTLATGWVALFVLEMTLECCDSNACFARATFLKISAADFVHT